jgi:drug/metabolite transporter (DMT)-like permease
MKPSPILINLALVLIALLWGAGFLPQRLGLETLEPMAFNVWRFGFGALTLIPILICLRFKYLDAFNPKLLLAGLVLGLLLGAGAGFQQASIGLTKVANVAFITGFYVIFVPVLGLLFRHRYSAITWGGGALALLGLALLSGVQHEQLLNSNSVKGDFLALVGAIFWAIHLLAINHYVAKHNPYLLAFYQFLFCALFSLLTNMVFEASLLASDYSGYLWAFISGVFVVGGAYTIQVVVMKYSEPFVAAIIFSFESVFGALVGYWFFQEVLGFYGLVGAGLMMLGCIMAQWPQNS